jgi:uncharacterized repeat protein (TIGR03943 family)
MPSRLYRLLQSVLLIALCIFLAEKAISGKLTWYINLRFLPLTIIGVVLLAIMAQAVFNGSRDKWADHEHVHTLPGGLLILMIPVLVGVLLPARPLDASAVDSKGISINAPLVSANTAAQQFESAPDQRNIMDWIRIFAYESDLSPYLNQQANVIGFVYYDDSLPEDQFLVSRFVITCCAADGFALGIPVKWKGERFEENDWVTVKGPVQQTEWNGQKMPLILAESVEITRAPEQPYLFP